MAVVLLEGRGPRRRVLLDGRRTAFGVLTPKTKRLACPHQTPLPRDLIEFHESPRLPSGAFAVLGLISLSHRSLQGAPRRARHARFGMVEPGMSLPAAKGRPMRQNL